MSTTSTTAARLTCLLGESSSERIRRVGARHAAQVMEGKGFLALGLGLPALGVAAGGSWTMMVCVLAMLLLPAACAAAVPSARRWVAARAQHVALLCSLARSAGERALAQPASTAATVSRAAALARLVRATAARIASRVLTRVGVVHVCVQPSHVTSEQGAAAYN